MGITATKWSTAPPLGVSNVGRLLGGWKAQSAYVDKGFLRGYIYMKGLDLILLIRRLTLTRASINNPSNPTLETLIIINLCLHVDEFHRKIKRKRVKVLLLLCLHSISLYFSLYMFRKLEFNTNNIYKNLNTCFLYLYFWDISQSSLER